MVKFLIVLIILVPLFLFGQKSDTLVWEDSFGSTYSKGSIAYNYTLNHPSFNPLNKEGLEFLRSFENDAVVLQTSYNFNGEKAILRCDKIYTFCLIYINNKIVLNTNSAFHPWEIDITKYLTKGENSIIVVFTPSIKIGIEQQYPYVHPAPNDLSTPQIASLVRKPQFMFGWDWAPRLNLMGFLDVVRIETEVELFSNPFVRLLEFKEGNAIIERSIDVKDSTIDRVLWKIDDDEKWFSVKSGKLKSIDTIENAILWEPGQLNELYKEKWRFRNKSFQRYIDVNYGLRNVELIQTPDSKGTPFYFKVNKEFVFCKGSNLVPLDVFPEKVDKKRLRNLVLDAHNANMNMLRVWGGGDYLPEYFYDLCDSLGIMVWQDFMFACAMYPGSSSFLNSVEREALFQVKRLRNHPSVVYFNGNNEVDVAWRNWGFQQEEKYRLNRRAKKEIEKAYDHLFKGVLKTVVDENTDLPYVHTSPLSNWGASENFNHSTMHYWGVWHGSDSLNGFWKKIGRFNAEFGFQSFPSPYALSQITNKENWSLENDEIKARQKSYIGSNKIIDFVLREYGGYDDFQEFVYKSQLVQAKGVGGALAAHRLSSPVCGGSLFWQFNDCWPAPTWSAIDYYNERKALYYAAKRMFATKTIIRDPNHLQDFYFLQEEVPKEKQVLKLEYYTFNGDLVLSSFNSLTAEHKQKLKVDSSLGDYLIIHLGEKKFEFILSEEDIENTIQEKSIEIVKLDFDEYSRKGKLSFRVNNFVASVQFYSEKFPLIFEENFNSYLPGEYSVNFELRGAGIPKVKDIYHQGIK